MSKQKSSFATNVSKLITGSLVAQGIGVLAAPVVARIYSPEAFGVAALFASITGIAGGVACLRYELSIMLPETDEEAANLMGLSLFFVLIITGILTIVIFFAGNDISDLLNSPALKKVLWLIPISVFAIGTFLALSYWSSRTKNFGRLSIARLISSIFTQSTKLGAGYSGFASSAVLIESGILGQLVSAIFLSIYIWFDDRHLFRASIRWKKMIAGLRRHKKFLIFGTWSALLNTTSNQLPALLLSIYFSPRIVGFYALGKAVMGLPMSVVGGAVAQVFYQKATDAHNRIGNLSKVVEEIFNRLVSLGIFPILLLTIVGKEIFIVAFGQRWAEAGIYLQILGLWIFFQFISSPISTLFAVLEKQNYGLFFNALLFSTRAASLIVGGMTADIRFTLFLFASTGVACYAFLCFWLISKAGLSISKALQCIVKYTIFSSPLLLIIVIAKSSLYGCEMGVLLIGLCALVVYYSLLIGRDERLRNSVCKLLQRAIMIR